MTDVLVEAVLLGGGRQGHGGGDVRRGVIAGEAVVEVDGGLTVVQGGRHAGVGGGPPVEWRTVEVSLEDLTLAVGPRYPPHVSLQTTTLRHPQS